VRERKCVEQSIRNCSNSIQVHRIIDHTQSATYIASFARLTSLSLPPSLYLPLYLFLSISLLLPPSMAFSLLSLSDCRGLSRMVHRFLYHAHAYMHTPRLAVEQVYHRKQVYDETSCVTRHEYTIANKCTTLAKVHVTQVNSPCHIT